MGINNNGPCFSILPFSDRKNYLKPAIWVDKLQPYSMICGSGHEGDDGGGANKDNTFWDKNESLGLEGESQDRSLWDKEE